MIEAGDGNEALARIERDDPDAVLLDLKMPGRDGLAVLAELGPALAELPVIVITAYGGSAAAIEAMRRGAYDYLTQAVRPRRGATDPQAGVAAASPGLRGQGAPGPDRREPDEASRRTGGRRARARRPERRDARGLQGDRPRRRDRRRGARSSARAAPARSWSPPPCTATRTAPPARSSGSTAGRCPRAWSRASCSATSGAPSPVPTARSPAGSSAPPAARSSSTRWASCRLSAQAKILRVLQQREFERVGGTETLRTDARVISATHRDLSKEVAAGRFREDLFYRLNVARIVIPPLRDRPEDIPLLAEHILRRVERQARLGRAVALSRGPRGHPGAALAGKRPATGERPGASGDRRAGPDHPARAPRRRGAARPGNARRGRPAESLPLRALLAEVERRAIQRALLACGGNRTKTAERLGISRRQLFDKIREYDLLP